MKVEGKRFVVFWLTLVLILLLAGATPAQEIFQFLTHEIKLEILPESIFEARFGDNPDVPRTDAAIIALARKLYPPLGAKPPEAAAQPPQECREYEVGLLFAALQNPAVSDQTRRQVDYIMEAAIPPLPKTYTSGHFKFYYTNNNANPDHNVTLADIQATATRLNSYWNTYVANFKTPQHYHSGATDMVDVNVYYLGDALYGQTGSSWNYINLNSKLTVKDACKRRTTSAHELFHRVQYSYGYISGKANMRWIVEGTAAWSQKYTNQSLRDYMARMNQGLGAPNLDLIKDRSYDACHFWVYLQKLAGTWAAIKDVWARYEVNGNNAGAAVNTVTTNRLGKNFNQFVQAWVKANCLKDLTNAQTGGYEYDEDEVTQTSCGVTYGPLCHVPTDINYIPDNAWYLRKDGRVSSYGADYYDLQLGPNLTQLQVKVTGAGWGDFSYHFIGVKGNRWKSIINKTSASYTYKKTLTPGQWDRLVLVVAGRIRGGDYTIVVGSSCNLTGLWGGGFNDIWTLNHDPVTNLISGTMELKEKSFCPGIWNVTGSYQDGKVTLDAVYEGGLPRGCCNLQYTATVLNSRALLGTLKYHGSSDCDRYEPVTEYRLYKSVGGVQGPGPAACNCGNPPADDSPQ